MFFEDFDLLINYYKNLFENISGFKQITTYWTFRFLSKTVKKRIRKDLKVLNKFEKSKNKLINNNFKKNKKKGLVSYQYADLELHKKEKQILKDLKENLKNLNNVEESKQVDEKEKSVNQENGNKTKKKKLNDCSKEHPVRVARRGDRARSNEE